jgi:hypothetical protein
MAHASQLGRHLGREVVNLGFAGRAWCEPVVAEAMARQDACLYLVDVLPNNGEGELPDRLGTFLRRLREFRADTPILLVCDRLFGDAAFCPSRLATQRGKNAALQDTLAELQSEGVPELYLTMHPNWFGDDMEGTADASHPNDLGATRMAASLGNDVKAILQQKDA